MAGRLRQVTELYETELQRVTAERAEGMRFLRYAAAHYQYPFDQQILLYGTACGLPHVGRKIRPCAVPAVLSRVHARRHHQGADGAAPEHDAVHRLHPRADG